MDGLGPAGTLRLRRARADEREMLEALQRRASLANAGDRDALLAHPEVIHLPPEQIAQRRVVVLEDGGQRLGFAVVLPPVEGAAELDGLFVEPDHWRRGLGRRLVEEVVRIAAAEGARRLHLVANPHALAFYRACGFAVEAPFETRFGPAVTMARAL